METLQNDNGNEITKRPPVIGRIALRSAKSARLSLARMIREYANNGGDAIKYRTLTYMFSELLAYFRFEKENEIEARLDAIEKKVEDLRREKVVG